MEYTKSIGDYYETFEGNPEEIAKLLRMIPEGIKESGVVEADIEQKELAIDEEEMIDFIYNNAKLKPTTELRYAIRKILDLELEYLKVKGIAG